MSEAVKITKRKCRWCGGEYRAPKGEKWAGCLDCQPRLTDAAAAREDLREHRAECSPQT